MAVKNILFDFDGVILDSMPVRESGFAILFKDFPEEKVSQLLRYHRNNGGLSRYHKFRYFYETILQQEITDARVSELAAAFSAIMRKELTSHALIIRDAVEFIKNHYQQYNMHIVSGSDGEELRYLCGQLGLADYFITIEGSPTPKIKLVKDILEKYAYDPVETVLVGDSMNDYDAAKANHLHFLGYRFFSEDPAADIYHLKKMADMLQSPVF
jgi:HAD superfamily hydrolase (TIGR01549 family)